MSISHEQDHHVQDHARLVEALTTGFGALLGQIQELARTNTELDRRLARVHKEVSSTPHFVTSLNLL